MQPLKEKLTIQQGRTFTKRVRWETEPLRYVPISAMSQSGPVGITTSTPHGIPDGWRVAVASVLGMVELNAASNPPGEQDFRRATVIDATSIEFNEVNSAEYAAYVSGGYLVFYTPVDLTGATARMSIKDKTGAVLLDLTTENGRLVIDPAGFTVSILISAEDAALITWRTGVYDLEIVTGVGEVHALLYGSVSVTREVTT